MACFDYAASIAKGDVTQHQVGDKMQSITLKERQMWAQIAAKIGLIGVNLSRDMTSDKSTRTWIN